MVGIKNYLDRISVDLSSKARSNVKATNPCHKKVCFVSLSPKEKGFFFAGAKGIDRENILKLYAHLQTNNERAIEDWFQKHTNRAYSPKAELHLLKNLAPDISATRIENLQGEDYDYFNELKRQYKVHLEMNSCSDFSLVHLLDENEENNVNPSPGPSMVFIIEGIYSLGIGNKVSEFSDEESVAKDISIGKLKSRIRQIKGEEILDDSDLKRWHHPPLLMRLASHFGNSVFGHAKSFSKCTQTILDQRSFLNKGVIKTCGYEIVRELLGLDEHLQPTGSRRILIDMHQLSASSRNDLYQSVFREFNRNISPDHPIPIVFTEAAYSGIDSLTEMIINGRNEVETDSFRVHGYNGCGINLSDEDVLEVFKSQGLISLTLDETRMGNDFGGFERIFMNKARSRAVRMLGRQLSAIVSVPFAYHLPFPLRIWDCLNIGNGLTRRGSECLERYRTEFHFLEDDLYELLSRLKAEEPAWFGSHKPEDLVQKILRHNVVDFVTRNYSD